MPYERAVEALGEVLRPDQVSVLRADRLAHGSDAWPLGGIRRQQGTPVLAWPDCVAWPESTRDVVNIVSVCHRHGIPITAWGAGSGVCGGAVADRGGVVVDLRRMQRIGPVDEVSRIVEVEAGVLGIELERTLQAQGWTVGHYPSSIACSSVGGWVAARGAGQCSSRYGKIEDMTLGVEAVVPPGEVVRTGEFGPIDAPDLTPLFVGSEGTLGIVTRVAFKLWPLPSAREGAGIVFRDLDSAVDAMRRVMQAGLRPAVMRLYDPLDTALNASLLHHDGDETGHSRWQGRLAAAVRRRIEPVLDAAVRSGWAALLSHPVAVGRAGALLRRALLVVIVEGEEASDVRARLHQAVRECVDAGGTDLGAGPADAWLRHRYDVSFKQSPVFAAGGFVDTLEVAAPWSRLLTVYDAVRAALAPSVVVMAHFSHAYEEGCSIYFTFAGRGESPQHNEEIYQRAWRAGLEAALRAGAAPSHHHGIGRSKAEVLALAMGEGRALLDCTRQAFDPHGVMNPGNLLPPRTGAVPHGGVP